MYGWLFLFVLIGGIIWYVDYDERQYGEQREVQRKEHIVDSLQERCVNGVSYYFSDGSQHVRFAPVVDAKTLTFKRCDDV